MRSYAKVIALVQRKSESVKETLLAGVEDPQKTMADSKMVTMKYV